MNKIFTIFMLFFFATSANSEVKDKVLNKASKKISEVVGNLIPGEGLTEASVTLKDNNSGNGNWQFNILAVRDIINSDNSNLFTQFSLHDQEIDSDKRIIGNLGLGYRVLSSDQSMMLGANTFLDRDMSEGHERVSFGLEAKAAMLNFDFNQYQKATLQKEVSGTKEQVLSGTEYNLSSQIPYMPWSTFNFQGYRWENEKAENYQKGNIYSLEMSLTPSLEFNIGKDVSSVTGVDDEHSYILTFVYPPSDNKPSLMDGAIAELAFEEKNMQAALKDKVRRNNNLAVEIQGSVIITSK